MKVHSEESDVGIFINESASCNCSEIIILRYLFGGIWISTKKGERCGIHANERKAVIISFFLATAALLLICAT